MHAFFYGAFQLPGRPAQVDLCGLHAGVLVKFPRRFDVIPARLIYFLSGELSETVRRYVVIAKIFPYSFELFLHLAGRDGEYEGIR